MGEPRDEVGRHDFESDRAALGSVQKDAGHVPDTPAEHADRSPEDVAETMLRGHVRPPSAR